MARTSWTALRQGLRWSNRLCSRHPTPRAGGTAGGLLLGPRMRPPSQLPSHWPCTHSRAGVKGPHCERDAGGTPAGPLDWKQADGTGQQVAARPPHPGPGTHAAWQETHGTSCWGHQAGRCQGPGPPTRTPEVKALLTDSSHGLPVRVMGAGTWGKNWRFLVKLNTELPRDLAIPLPSTGPGETYIQPQKRP